MKAKLVLVALAILAGAAALAWSRRGSAPESPALPGAAEGFTAEEVFRILQHSPIGPPPPDPTNAVADQPAYMYGFCGGTIGLELSPRRVVTVVRGARASASARNDGPMLSQAPETPAGTFRILFSRTELAEKYASFS